MDRAGQTVEELNRRTFKFLECSDCDRDRIG